MRQLLAAFLLVAAAVGVVAEEVSHALTRGVASYHTGDHTAAVGDLSIALQEFLDDAPRYVETGRFDSLTSLETTLVYLALSQFRLGDEDAARQTILRLHAAERIRPTYATLAIGADATDFETLNTALLPARALPRNVRPAPEDPGAPLPPIVPKSEENLATRAERESIVQALGVTLLPAEARVAEMPPPAAPDPIARERVFDPEPTRQSAPVASQTPVPQQTFNAQPSTEQQVPAETRVSIPAGELLTTLRAADAAANGGRFGEAVQLYTRIASAREVPREVLGEAAVGLYRTAAFRESVQAFQRFGTFARGEEDLRFYYAISLYESGYYTEAKKELECALPFLIESDDVLRYRYRIEMFAQLAKY